MKKKKQTNLQTELANLLLAAFPSSLSNKKQHLDPLTLCYIFNFFFFYNYKLFSKSPKGKTKAFKKWLKSKFMRVYFFFFFPIWIKIHLHKCNVASLGFQYDHIYSFSMVSKLSTLATTEVDIKCEGF